MKTPNRLPYAIGAAMLLLPLLWLALMPAGARAAALTPEQLPGHVLNRLAFGPRPGDLALLGQMGVQRYIDAQLDPASIPMPAALAARLDALETANQPAGAALGAFLAVRGQVKEDSEEARQQRRAVLQRMGQQAAAARLLRAVDSPRQLQEVMVDFWFNHFNVYAGKGVDRALVANYERDAIRPYALGSFRDLLDATAKHPAMLYYLDNWVSTADHVGAGGKANGKKAKASGLNENYARELMELHTLGVDGGYTQHDVTELARMLTGWTYNQNQLVRSNVMFQFEPRRHDQGDKQWLGQSVPAQGQAEGEYALDVLAMHPATARHISYQLAQYFVQDRPPPALVERMARTWLDRHGDIGAVLRTLFASAEFRSSDALGAKFKTPYQYVVSAARASGLALADAAPLTGALNRLGQPLYGCQTPDGYQNTEAAWLNPDALSRRIGVATTLLALTPQLDMAQLQATLGASLSARTLALAAGGPPKLRTAMLLGSPDFMQR